MGFLHILYVLLIVAQFLSGIALISIVIMQESKTDGLTGQIGTTATSSFKGKSGKEEFFNLWTRNIAIVFFAVSVMVAMTTKRWN